MKIIDLLNKIANGEEVPKKIKYDGTIYEYSENDDFYYWKESSLYREFATNGNCLDKEVEIIEEPKVITKENIEALEYACGEIRKCFENGWNKLLGNKPLIEEDKKIEKLNLPSLEEFKNMSVAERYVVTAKEYDVLNELIDEINKLKEK